MSESKQATVCLIASPELDVFRCALGSLLRHTPADRIELRLAFSQAADSLANAVGALAPDGVWLNRVERLDGRASAVDPRVDHCAPA